MSDFEEILVTETGVGKGRWRTSKLGAWLYIIDGYLGTNGEVYPSKSKSGNPFMIKVHSESLDKFIDHLQSARAMMSGGWNPQQAPQQQSLPNKDDDNVPF